MQKMQVLIYRTDTERCSITNTVFLAAAETV